MSDKKQEIKTLFASNLNGGKFRLHRFVFVLLRLWLRRCRLKQQWMCRHLETSALLSLVALPTFIPAWWQTLLKILKSLSGLAMDINH